MRLNAGAEVFRALLDTGADANMMREDVYERIGRPKPLLPPPLTLKSYGGVLIRTVGVIELRLTLINTKTGEEFSHTTIFFVVPLEATDEPLLLGQPGLSYALDTGPNFKKGLKPDSMIPREAGGTPLGGPLVVEKGVVVPPNSKKYAIVSFHDSIREVARHKALHIQCTPLDLFNRSGVPLNITFEAHDLDPSNFHFQRFSVYNICIKNESD